jgi:phenylpropionate dioxygenase-like ring-hydroxylating dioxygenase large terminal subunit
MARLAFPARRQKEPTEPTEEERVARFPKPAEGTWTQHYPDLGTGEVSYEDSVSPEFFELEREAIFKRAWLTVGRVEQLPRTGSYFTREIAVARTSVVVVRDQQGSIRAFHNVCRHRGNKLVWNDYPRQETSGVCRQFVCKYHGWRYDLDGSCSFVQQEGEFFDLDRSDYGLVAVHCEVWAGFVFVNLDPEPRQTLTEFLGPMVTGIEGYPFEHMTEVYALRAVAPVNWKIFSDALQEQYHAPIVHRNQRPENFEVPMQKGGFEAPHYGIDGPHRVMTTPGIRPWELPPDQVKPMETLTRSGMFGAWDRADVDPPVDTRAAGINPGGCEPFGVSLFGIWPNFGIQFWERGWYHTYHHWPISYDSHLFECYLHFPPARTARERVAHEMAVVSWKEFALQDDNIISAIQMTLESGVVTSFPLGDQEVLCRHIHRTAAEWVDGYRRERAGV